MNIFNPFKPEKELIVTFLVNVNKYLYAVHHNNTLCSVTNCFFICKIKFQKGNKIIILLLFKR